MPIGQRGAWAADNVADGDVPDRKDAPSMADAVISLLETPALASRVGDGARRWAERTLSMEDYPERLERMLERT